MGYFVARSVVVMVPAFLLGLFVGWLWWGSRGSRATASAPAADEAIELAPRPTSPAHRAEPDRPVGPGPDARSATVPVAVPVPAVAHVADPVPAAPLDPEVERLLAEAMAAASAPPSPAGTAALLDLRDGAQIPPAPDQDDDQGDDQDHDQDHDQDGDQLEKDDDQLDDDLERAERSQGNGRPA